MEAAKYGDLPAEAKYKMLFHCIKHAKSHCLGKSFLPNTQEFCLGKSMASRLT